MNSTAIQFAAVIGIDWSDQKHDLSLYDCSQQTASGDAPTVPVIYWHATTETGQRELFVGLLEHLKYRITNGTISDLRERVYRLLRACQVEMIILDEAH